MIPAVYVEHIIRVVVTFVLFVVLKWPTNPYVLVLAIMLLDGIGSLYALFGKDGGWENKERVTKTEAYQQTDKISDALTYLMLFSLFPNDPVLHFFVVYRAIGVFLYAWTKKRWPVIVFFDFVKEYILYKQLFSHSEHANAIFGVSIVLKILFEIYFHTIHNKHEGLTDDGAPA